MNTLSINPAMVINTENFTFVEIHSMYAGFFDVMYKGQRIAILNGLSAPLQWGAMETAEIPFQIVDELEDLVRVFLAASH